jgi:hypothetical protein
MDMYKEQNTAKTNLLQVLWKTCKKPQAVSTVSTENSQNDKENYCSLTTHSRKINCTKQFILLF